MEAKRNMSGFPETQLLHTHTHPRRKPHGVAVTPAGSEVDMQAFGITYGPVGTGRQTLGLGPEHVRRGGAVVLRTLPTRTHCHSLETACRL